VSWAIETKSYSQRRACALIGMSPKTYRYEARRADDAALRARLKALAAERRRFGYRRLKLLLEREGFVVNHKKVYRIYREERLAVRKRGGRKRALGTRAPAAVPQGPNQRWSLDFVSDALSDGRRFRVLCIVDDFTRECLGLVADTSLSGRRVARELDRLITERGKPALVVSDNGTELTSTARSSCWRPDDYEVTAAEPRLSPGTNNRGSSPSLITRPQRLATPAHVGRTSASLLRPRISDRRKIIIAGRRPGYQDIAR